MRKIVAILFLAVVGLSPAARADSGTTTAEQVFTDLARSVLEQYGQTDQARELYANQRQYRGPKKIPPGHMPPPGLCRGWIFGEPPGHQPPVGDCDSVAASLPPGAQLIYGGPARNSRLPTIFGKSLPSDVRARLPRWDGADPVVVGDDVVLIDAATRVILDVLKGAIRDN